MQIEICCSQSDVHTRLGPLELRTVSVMLRLIWRHPSNRGRRLRSLFKAVLWQGYKRVVRRPITVRAYGSINIRCYPGSNEGGRFIYFSGFPDFDQMTFVRRYLRPGDRFLDCGAHLGTYSLLAASIVGSKGEVHAFEAAPAAVAMLCENLVRNNITCVRVHVGAVGDRTGFVPFVVTRKGGTGNRLRTTDDSGELAVQVACLRLDDVLDEGPYAMGKLDIEGAEPLAFLGAEGLIKRASPPVWQLELVDRFTRRFGWSARAIQEWLGDRGFTMATYDADRNALRLGSGVVGSKTDVLAIASSSLDEVVAKVGCSVVTSEGS